MGKSLLRGNFSWEIRLDRLRGASRFFVRFRNRDLTIGRLAMRKKLARVATVERIRFL